MNILARTLTTSIVNVVPTYKLGMQQMKERRKKRKNETTPENIPPEVWEKMPLGFRALVTIAYRDGVNFDYEPDNGIIRMRNFLDIPFTSFDAETGKCTDDENPFSSIMPIIIS